MNVRIAGDGPAAEAVVAALADTDAESERVEAGAVDGGDLGIVVGPVGDESFETVNEVADGPWLAVELGGIGGAPVSGVDAAVTGLESGRGCYDCLRARVAANARETDEGDVDAPTARLAGAVAGRQAVGFLSEEGDIVGAVHELPHQNRSFLPVPGCCVSRDRTIRRDHEDVSLDDAVGRAEQTLDPRVGLVSDIGEVESFPAPYYLATNSETSVFSDASAPKQAAGVDDDWNAAFMKAVGEALERYSSAVYRNSEFQSMPPAMVEGGVAPDAVVRRDDAPAVDPEEPIPWVMGENLATEEETPLPAEIVQFPPPEERYTDAITTGLGLGSSGADALVSGLTEVIERDATMLAWYSTFEPLELRVDDEAYQTLARRARSEGLRTTALLVTQDVDVPVVAVAVHRENGDWPAFAVGSGAALDPVDAARSGLAEALQNWMELRSMGRSKSTDEPGAIAAFADFPSAAADFLDAGGPVPATSVGPDDPATGAEAVDELVGRVTDADLTPYAVRLTPPDVAQAGFEAVRVVVPGAQPLFTDQPAFGKRAESVPESLGFDPRLNRRHHPYP
ncbi:YcaO-like family protein [Haloarchaeobius sp. HME9146]|uniref:YcaO-like family protein n=1 Tax=Haloarchaeobius sp. HME9146 TaxID=2978732 RepID=UPI0021BE47F0|nr:YcaO-like family protein [Haloarchaeobius sp. HME9146]MCT9097290.1 YcaO-like family protein [Haloarchaeobius sp. HME9146]